MRVAYERGLHELGDGLYAYLQPDGSWGWSNAGLIAADGTSLLVDTLFDLELTREMLDAMRRVTERSPIDAAMNTHGNGDHCFGNQLAACGSPIYATQARAAELQAAPPQLVHVLKHATTSVPSSPRFIRSASSAPLRLRGHRAAPARRTTFEGRARPARSATGPSHLIEVGPAHTDGDAIVHVPDAGVVFTGDILFIGGTPIVWAGPFSNWLARVRPDPRPRRGMLVPGHGPVTDASGVHDVQRYLTYVRDEAARSLRRRDGRRAPPPTTSTSATSPPGATPSASPSTSTTLYREFDPSRPPASRPELFVRMARWASRH